LEILELPSRFGSRQTEFAFDINDAGVAIGGAGAYEGGAVRWDASGAATELKSPLAGPATTEASDMNSAGVVVGSSYPNANNLMSRAVYWGLDAVPVDLNSLIDPASGWTLTSAQAISDTGWIGGQGRFDPDGPSGQAAIDRLFLMHVPAAAVPEPAAGALALLGVAGILLFRRRSLRRPNKFSL
jgi:hypothetical protein